MEKTLYLRQANRLRIQRDGPSLWITERGKAGSRVPVRMVGRVVVIGNLRLEAAALTLFSENGVPVTFLDERGTVLGTLLSWDDPLTTRRERQAAVMERPHSLRRAQDWLAAKRKRLQLAFLRTFAAEKAPDYEGAGFTEVYYRSARDVMCKAEGGAHHAVKRFLQGLLFEMLSIEIKNRGFDPHLGIRSRGRNFGFCRDLARVMEPEVDRLVMRLVTGPSMNGCVVSLGKSRRLTPGGMRALVKEFEYRKGHLQVVIRAVLDDYCRLLREIP